MNKTKWFNSGVLSYRKFSISRNCCISDTEVGKFGAIKVCECVKISENGNRAKDIRLYKVNTDKKELNITVETGVQFGKWSLEKRDNIRLSGSLPVPCLFCNKYKKRG